LVYVFRSLFGLALLLWRSVKVLAKQIVESLVEGECFVFWFGIRVIEVLSFLNSYNIASSQCARIGGNPETSGF
jgi:hypothetical protein